MAMELKEAARRAMEFVAELYDLQNSPSLRLEEVDTSEEGHWLITVGFDISRPSDGPFTSALSGFIGVERQFKTVEVDRQTGEVRSMKIRIPA